LFSQEELIIPEMEPYTGTTSFSVTQDKGIFPVKLTGFQF